MDIFRCSCCIVMSSIHLRHTRSWSIRSSWVPQANKNHRHTGNIVENKCMACTSSFHPVWIHHRYRNKESATETVNSGSIPGRVKPKTIKIGIYSSTFSIYSSKSPPCVVDRWQLDLKTERSFSCLLAKVTWWIKYYYNWWSTTKGESFINST